MTVHIDIPTGYGFRQYHLEEEDYAKCLDFFCGRAVRGGIRVLIVLLGFWLIEKASYHHGASSPCDLLHHYRR
jgi:hypothetical protein